MNESGATLLELDPAEARDGLVRSGGKPYILIVLKDESTGEIELVTQGFTPEQIVNGLYEAGYQLEKALIDEAIASGVLDADGPTFTDDELAEALERAKQL